MVIRSQWRRAFAHTAASFAMVFAVSSLPLHANGVSAQDVPARAQVEDVLKGLNRSHGLGPVAISPDGALLAYVRHGKDGSELVLAPFSEPAKATMQTSSGAGFGMATNSRSTRMASNAIVAVRAGPEIARQSNCMPVSRCARE